MHRLYIPNLLDVGSESRVWRRRLYIAFILALLLHLGLFLGFEQFAQLSRLNFFAPVEFALPQEKPLQMVVVDEDLLHEEKPDDDLARLRGRVTRTSRDTEIDPTQPKLGPSGESERPFDAFKIGETSPVARSNPSPMTEAQPVPESPATPEIPAVKPREALPEPIPETPPAVKPPEVTEEEVKKIEDAKVAEVKAEATPPPPPLAMPEVVEATATALPPREKPPVENETVTAKNEPEIKEIAKTKNEPQEKTREKPTEKIGEKTTEKPVEKIDEKLLAQAEPRYQQPDIAPRPETAPQTPSKPVPSRRIGNSSQVSDGGKLRATGGSAAMQAGIKSMAVLRDRYGEYMDTVLRRIQEAIYIQQQLSPPMFNRGVAVFNFTISPSGILENINFLGTQPSDLTQETAAARGVLNLVRDGKPLPQPSAEMLNDPDFQRITINFLFEPR